MNISTSPIAAWIFSNMVSPLNNGHLRGRGGYAATKIGMTRRLWPRA
jgi:hypothetical protein